jgi:hypothetical protein
MAENSEVMGKWSQERQYSNNWPAPAFCSTVIAPLSTLDLMRGQRTSAGCAVW